MHDVLARMKRSNGGNASVSEKQSYSTTVLLEEIVILRKKIKELEDDSSSSGANSSPSVQSTEASNQDDIVASLRKELSQSRNEKAAMELDFMNQISGLASDHDDAVDELKVKMAKSEGELEFLRDTQPKTEDEATKAIHALKAKQATELKQLQDDLAAADVELKVHRDEADELHQKIKDLESHRKSLLEEVSDTRLEVENGAISVSSLQNEMDEMEKHYKGKTLKLESKIRESGEVNSRLQDEIATMSDCVLGLENAKSMLLDEITDLRMQLDRDDDTKASLLKRIDEMSKQQSAGGLVLATAAVEQRAKEAESKVEELEKANQKAQAELREMTVSYKTDVARLDEAVSSHETKTEQIKLEVKRKEADLADVQERCVLLESELQTLKMKLAREKAVASDACTELSTFQLQQSAYEQRTSEFLLQYIAEIDEIKLENVALKTEVSTLATNLSSEKTVCESLKVEMTTLKASAAVVSATLAASDVSKKGETMSNGQNVVLTPRSPMASYNSSLGQSFSPSMHRLPSQSVGGSPSGRNFPPPIRVASPIHGNSVRTLAAAFEPSSPITTRAGFVGFKQLQTKPTLTVQLDETEELRQKVGEIAELERKLEELEGTRKSQLQSKMKEIEILHHNLTEEMERNSAMEEKLKSQSVIIGELRAEVATLTATRSAIQNLSRKEHEGKSLKDREEILRLSMELDSMREKLETESREIENLKNEIRSMTLERMNQEENDMGTYDHKIAVNRKSYDVEINNLQMQLTKERMRNSKLENDYQIQIKELEDTIDELNFECDKELAEKHAELELMKQKFEDNIDTVKQLESEREQLCMSMNSQSNARKEQFDELQAELMEKSAVNTQLARDIEKLQMHIQNEKELNDELEHLRQKVQELEGRQRPTNTATMRHLESMQVDDLKAENEKLRESARQIALERRALQDKINSILAEKNESRSVQVLRDRNESLKLEVIKLTKKIRKLDKNSSRIEL